MEGLAPLIFFAIIGLVQLLVIASDVAGSDTTLPLDLFAQLR